MCIICFKSANTKMPDIDLLLNCQDNNPDGDGFMLRKNGKVITRKGYFDTYRMVDEIYEICDNAPENYDIGIHYRWATHGNTDRGNCHPFVISRRKSMLREIESVTSHAMMHNGVISNMKPDSILSDTMVFIRKNAEILKLKPEKILNKTEGKFLYFSGNRVYHKGLILDKDNGCMWSNNGYTYSSFDYYKPGKKSNKSYDNSFDYDPFHNQYSDDAYDEYLQRVYEEEYERYEKEYGTSDDGFMNNEEREEAFWDIFNNWDTPEYK